MSNSIKLSPKHGLNPTIPVCYWCGKEKNQIALLGQIGDRRKGEDCEAPMKAVLDYAPCEHCEESWGNGVACIEVQTTRPEPYRPPIDSNRGLYPTGCVTVIKEESAQRVFNDPNIYKGQRVFIEDEAFQKLFSEVLPKK